MNAADVGPSMPQVTIYTTELCGYCRMAKRLLQAKGVAYDEIDVGRNPARREEMIDRAGGRYTVPQIFIGDTHVGGSDDLHALDRAGRLDPLLAG
jgi:glutaredoxin 3